MKSPAHARTSLWALIVAHTISRTGNVVTLFAIPFLVLETGGGPIQVGLAAAAATTEENGRMVGDGIPDFAAS